MFGAARHNGFMNALTSRHSLNRGAHLGVPPPMLVELHRRGPDTLDGVLAVHSEPEVRAAVRKAWLREHVIFGVRIVWLGRAGARWFEGVGGRALAVGTLMDMLVLRRVIEWHEARGWELLGWHESNPNGVWLLDPERRPELVFAKTKDYTDTGVNGVVAANGQVVASRGGRIVFLVRDSARREAIARQQQHMVVVRSLGLVLEEVTPRELPLYGGAL